MFCGECGAKNEKDSKFCEKCGKMLEPQKEEKTKKKKKEYREIFCASCGTKNSEEALFCEKCGEKIVKENEQKEKKTISKGTKIILIAVFIIALILGITYKFFDGITNPKYIAKEYVEAVINNDINKLYSYINVDGDTTFITKDIFKKIWEELQQNGNIINYKVGDVTYSDGNLSATVNFTYTTNNSTIEQTGKINLIKGKGKKYLLFDNWEISDFNANNLILDNFTLKVPKNSTVKFEGTIIDKKYLNENESTNTIDVYILPKVFKEEITIETELSNGFILIDDITPSDYNNTYKVDFSEESISEKEKDNIVSFSKEKILSLYESAIANKAWEEIKNNYPNSSKDIKDNYEEFIEDLKNNYSTLKTITLKSGSIYDIDMDQDLYIEVELRINYDYTVEYTSYDKQLKTSNKSSYSYMTIILGKNKDGYYLYDIDSLETNFYR